MSVSNVHTNLALLAVWRLWNDENLLFKKTELFIDFPHIVLFVIIVPHGKKRK